MQGSALTTGAAARKGLLLQWSENRGGFCRVCVEVRSAKGECPSAIAVGEKAEVADLDEARGQDVKQEARMNSTASRVMTLMRLLCLESRQRKRTWPLTRPRSLPLAMATR